MPGIPTFDEYISSLSRLTPHVDPLLVTEQTLAIQDAAASLAALPDVSREHLVPWVTGHPDGVPVLGLSVGLGLEKLRNSLKEQFDTSSWNKLARTRAVDLVTMLDEQFDLVEQLRRQRSRVYSFGDVLVARAGTRTLAARAGLSGRSVEDLIEDVARDLGLPYALRSRFVGRGGATAPCDLVVPNGENALIAVAAKGFDSTGSKLTDSVREVQEMADIRLPRQTIMAVIDGVGWLSRKADLARIHALWTSEAIDGMYTVATLDRFRTDLAEAARLHRLLPT